MLHRNPDTGKVGNCKAEQGKCPFKDSEDPNQGHYETQEEMDDYLERTGKKETSGVQEGLSSSTASKPKKPFPDPSLNLPENWGEFSADERIRYYYFKREREGGLMTLDKRGAMLSAVLGINEETGVPHLEELEKPENSTDYISRNVLEIIGRNNGFARLDSFGEELDLETKEIYSDSISLDFSKPDPLSFTKEEGDKGYDKARDALMKMGRLYEEVITRRMRNSWHVRLQKALPFETKASVRLREQISKDLGNYFYNKCLDTPNGKVKTLEKAYKNWAEERGYAGKAPDPSIPGKTGYRVPSGEVAKSVRAAIKANAYRKPGKYHRAAVSDLAQVYTKCSMKSRDGLEIDVLGVAVDIDGTKEKTIKDLSDMESVRLSVAKSKLGYAGSSVILDYNPQTGEGSYIDNSEKGGTVRAENKKPFTLTKKLPKEYTEDDLRNFVMSERIRYQVYEGKPWSKIEI